jgi:hypothetical protein
MPPGVPLALGPTDLTGRHAGLELGPQQAPIRLGLPGDQPAGRITDVGAVQVQPNAANQHLELRLAETGVSAGGAALGTIEASLNALRQRSGVDPGRARMGL